MSSYRSFGGLDDQSVYDGDAAFIGMNQREQPNQLRPGEVVLSQNGRMEGVWRPRRGIEIKSGQLATSASPLRLPFILLDTQVTISAAARTSNVVTITTSSPHGIGAGKLPAYITLGDVEVTTFPIAGIPAGAYLMSYVSATELSFANTGLDEASLAVNGTYGYLITTVDDNAVGEIYGSCLFSDPSSDSDESVIVATNGDARRVDLDDYSTSTIPYPAGMTLDAEVEMLQAFDRIFLFRNGDRAWEYVPKGRSIATASYVSSTGVVTIFLRDHGFSVGDKVTTSGIGFVTTNPNGYHTVASVSDEDTFTYVIATGGGNETYTQETGIATSDGFNLVPAGQYSQSQYFNIAGNKYGVSGGEVRFTVVGNNTIEIGDIIRITNTNEDSLLALNGQTFIVTRANSTDIFFNAPLADKTYGTGGGSKFIEFGKRQSLGLGFTHLPGAPWGVYFQRRLWCPYFYQPEGTGVAPTYRDRNVRDQICASDILDSGTFDSVESQFRVTAGIADYLVAMHPFYDDNMVVFNRNSIHLIAGTQGTLSDTTMREMTREVGCLARNSITSKGNAIFFLSDDGVYALEFLDEYNLRGTEEPLSKPIQPYIDRINQSLASRSVGIYFDNRYFLAVPLDSIVGANDATGNNSILIYNMKNKGWESIDTFGDNDFNIRNLLIGQAGDRNDLFIINENGGIHQYDARNRPQDSYSTSVTGAQSVSAVDYKLKTRGYAFGNHERKKFKKANVQMRSGSFNAVDVNFFFTTEDPDSSDTLVADVATLLSVENGGQGQLPVNEHADFTFRLGNPRGIYGVLTIASKDIGSSSVGRPQVSSIMVEATITNRTTITQS